MKRGKASQRRAGNACGVLHGNGRRSRRLRFTGNYYSHRLLAKTARNLWLLEKSELGLEPVAILGRVNKTEDHMAEVARIRVQRVDPVLEADRVRIASQVAEVLHRHKPAIEELIKHRLALDDRAQHLSASLRATVQRRHQRCFV